MIGGSILPLLAAIAPLMARPRTKNTIKKGIKNTLSVALALV